MNSGSVMEASQALLKQLQLLNKVTAKEKVVNTPKEELLAADKLGKTLPKVTVVKNPMHMYAVLVNKLYGLSGENKPHDDVVEYWLSLRNKWNGEKHK
jgi:hypothetical protein